VVNWADVVRRETDMSQQAYKYVATINPKGKVEIDVPLPPGTPVEVLILSPMEDNFSDLVGAAGSSLEFWDNALDDEDWNNA
jgi:hypothetical protein